MRHRTALTIAAFVAAGLLAWWVTSGGELPTNVPGVAHPPATLAAGMEHGVPGDTDRAVPASERRSAEPAPAPPAERAQTPPGLELRVRLRGLHPQAAWTGSLTLNLQGRDENEWLKYRADATPDERGEVTFELPAWAATAHYQEGRLDGADPNYRPVAARWQDPLDPASVRVVDVQVVANVTGRVVDSAGTPVPAACLVGFAFHGGAPVAPELARVNTRLDGTFHLVLPPDVPLSVLVTAMQSAGRFRPRTDSRSGGVVDTGEMRADLLPASALVHGRIGILGMVPDIVLSPATMLRGTVRWHDGAPIDLATVRATPRGGATLPVDQHNLVKFGAAGELFPGGNATTSAEGAFQLPARAGSVVDVSIVRLEEAHLIGAFALTVTPPERADFRLPRPMRLRARDGNRLVAGATFEVADGGMLTATLSGGIDVVAGRALRVRASKNQMRSGWVDVPASAGGTTVDIDLTNERVPLSIEFDGEFRVRNTIVSWRRDDGANGNQHLGRDDRSGPFQLFLEPGRYRITAGPGGGERNGVFLLPVERDVDLNAGPAALRLPAAFGGTFTVTATDSSGLHVAGTCRVHDSTGADASAAFLVRAGGTNRQGRTAELLPDGTNEFTGVLPPGVYELGFEFVHHGTQQQRVTIRAREVSDVRLRLP